MISTNKPVTLKDNQHWTAREELTVLSARERHGRLEYLLQSSDGRSEPNWFDWADVDGEEIDEGSPATSSPEPTK